MPEALTPGEVSERLSDLARGDVTAGQVRDVIATGRALIASITPIVGEPYDGAIEDWFRMEQVFQDAEAAMGGMPDADVIRPGSETWRRTVGPIMAGTCYGPPACAASAVEAAGGSLAVAPWGARPWVMLGAAEASDLAAEHAWNELQKDLARPMVAAGDFIASLARAFAVGAILWYVFDDER